MIVHSYSTGRCCRFGHFAIHMPHWDDTTEMDAIRGADITNHLVAGSMESELKLRA